MGHAAALRAARAAAMLFVVGSPVSFGARRPGPTSDFPTTGQRSTITADDGAPLVLIVDGDEDNRDLCAEPFAKAGLGVTTAVDGEHALLKVMSLKPALVMMDLVDGLEATRQITASASTAHIPVVVVAGHSDPEHRVRAKEVGAAEVAFKPCSPDALLEIALRRLGHWRTGR